MNKKLTITTIIIVGLFLIVGLGYSSYSLYTKKNNNDLGASVLRVSQGGTGNTSFPTGECLKGNLTGAITTGACGSGAGTVTSVGMTVPTGLTVSGVPITTAGTSTITLTSGYVIPLTASTTDWQTAYNGRLQWDGGSTNLVAATGRTSLGLGTMALLPDTGSSTITTLGVLGANLKLSPGYGLMPNTSDGSDSSFMVISGGGAAGVGRGGNIYVYGNENSNNGGISIDLGNKGTGKLSFSAASQEYGSMSYAGAWDFGGAPSFEIPNSATNVVSVAGQIGIDTTSGQLRWNDGTATSTLSATSTKDFALNLPVVGDKMNIWHVPMGITLVGIDCLSDNASSTSVSTGIDIFKGNSAGVATSTVLTGGTLTCLSTAETSTTTANVVAADSWIGFVVKTASGTPSWLQGSIKYRLTAD